MDKGCFFVLVRFRSVCLACYPCVDVPLLGRSGAKMALSGEGGVGRDAGELSVLQILERLPLTRAGDD